ncbi:uncharacterized protein [Lepeophtheirus salmonis]|nr:uncharacterized protein LOC121128013 [Lepeophtheirus salmonis]
MSSDLLFNDPRLGWIPYNDFSRSQREKSHHQDNSILGNVDSYPQYSEDPPPPEFFIPPPPPPPSLELDPDCTSLEDFQTCDNILTSSTLYDKDYPLLSGHLRSLSIILAVACLFILAVCVTIFIIWRRRRSRTRLDYLWKDSGQTPNRPDHSHHPLIFDDGFESSGGGGSGSNGTSSSNYRLNRALPRNEFSNDTLHSNIFRIPDSDSQIYEEVLDSSGRSAVSQDIIFQRNPTSTSNRPRQINPSYYSGTNQKLKDYSTDDSSTQGNNDLPLLSPTYSTPPIYAKHNPLPPLPSATLLRNREPPKKSKNIFSTWLHRNSKNSSSSSSSSPNLDYRFLTSKPRGGEPGTTPTLRLSDYPSALQQPLIYYSTTHRHPTGLAPPPPGHHIYTTPVNGNNFYGDYSGLMPNPDDILPKEAWTDFPNEDEEDLPENKIRHNLIERKQQPSASASLQPPRHHSRHLNNKIPSVLCKPNNNNINNTSCDTNSLNSLRNHHLSSLSSDTTCPDEESDERFNSSSNSSQGSVLR